MGATAVLTSPAMRKATPLHWWLHENPGMLGELERAAGISRQYIRRVANGEALLAYDAAQKIAARTGLPITHVGYRRVLRISAPILSRRSWAGGRVRRRS